MKRGRDVRVEGTIHIIEMLEDVLVVIGKNPRAREVDEGVD